MNAFDMNVTAVSSRDLKTQDFGRQVELIKPYMAWNPATWTWHGRLSTSRPEHATEVLNILFEAARVYGTTVMVERAPTDRADEPAASGQQPELGCRAGTARRRHAGSAALRQDP